MKTPTCRTKYVDWTEYYENYLAEQDLARGLGLLGAREDEVRAPKPYFERTDLRYWEGWGAKAYGLWHWAYEFDRVTKDRFNESWEK